MDILRKELNEIYSRQHLESEVLSEAERLKTIEAVGALAEVQNVCAVITDLSRDCSLLFPQSLGIRLGVADDTGCHEVPSTDEDAIYSLIHPEDLAYKRLLEYKFFLHAEQCAVQSRLDYKAVCRIRFKESNGHYICVDNSTQLLRLSPSGRMWLVLCTYRFAESNAATDGIDARIVNTHTGEIIACRLAKSRDGILSRREKEILCCIREGKLSKEIADSLHISINTVSRHRQNIRQLGGKHGRLETLVDRRLVAYVQRGMGQQRPANHNPLRYARL